MNSKKRRGESPGQSAGSAVRVRRAEWSGTSVRAGAVGGGGSMADRTAEDVAALTERLREVCQGRGFSEIAYLTYNVVSRNTVAKYITGGHRPSPEFLTALCRSLGVSADWLLLGRGPKHAADMDTFVLERASFTQLCEALGRQLTQLQEIVSQLESGSPGHGLPGKTLNSA